MVCRNLPSPRAYTARYARWCTRLGEPDSRGRNRANLDALLREVAARGVWVSAHPDVILKMGTKEVLHRTRTISWGCDTALYRTVAAMRAEMPARLAAGPQRRPGRLEGRDAGKSAQPANGTRA